MESKPVVEPDKENPGSSSVDQVQLGTLINHLATVESRFADIVEHNIEAGPLFRNSCQELLRMFEADRIKAEAAIQSYKDAILFERARQRSCSLHSNLLLAIIGKYVDVELKKKNLIPETPDTPQLPSPGADGVNDEAKPIRETESEAMSRLCVCACQDEIDIKGCTCRCHTGHPCKDTKCNVCPVWRKKGSVPDNVTIVVRQVKKRTVKAQPAKKVAKKAVKKK